MTVPILVASNYLLAEAAIYRGLAMGDGAVGDRERAVLSSIFSRVNVASVGIAPAVADAF